MYFWIFREECKVTELQATMVTELQTSEPKKNEVLFYRNKSQMFHNLHLLYIKDKLDNHKYIT